MQQPYQYDLTGNRTRVYAVRGRRLASRTQRSTKLSHASISITLNSIIHILPVVNYKFSKFLIFFRQLEK